ncbi:hypothetical protein N309_05564, partial [Tinamus guttatus]
KLLISEINPDNPGGREDTEYIELFYTGRRHFDLQGYWLVLYNGKNNLAYRVLDLSGHHTNELGFFLVGSSAVSPAPMIRLPSNTIQNGADAVALYYSNTTSSYKATAAVTARGLVDAVVYTSRPSEKADRLIQVLLPGQSILYEDDSHSPEDESLSRCNSLSAKLQSSFQVTVTTPLAENSCSPSAALPPRASAILINELCLVNGTAPYCFVELKGEPGASLKGHNLVLFSKKGGKVSASIPLWGTFGATGLFVLAADGEPKHDDMKPTVKDIPAASEGYGAIAVYNTSLIPGDMKATAENLVDAVVFTCGPGSGGGQLDVLGPSYVVPCKGDRPVSLSRCPCCGAALHFAVSAPTPGVRNSCPQEALGVDLDLCFLTPDCSAWALNRSRMLESMGSVLLDSLEQNCSCGVSRLYLQELNATCADGLVQVSGQVWARQPEQQRDIMAWHRGLLASPQPLSVEGRVLRSSAECSTWRNAPQMSPGGSSFQGWEIALFVVGSLLLALLLIGLAFHLIRRHPPHYTNIEMNDRREMAADF